MTCVNPYVVSIGRAFGCGRCYFCRIKNSKVWTHRIILEASEHEVNSFVTLTYSDENLPANNSLDPRELQLFFKRLRKEIAPAKVRFFAVGEYGDLTHRPHYHIALFGYPPCIGNTVRKGTACSCVHCLPIARAWSRNNKPLGFISVGTLEPGSAAYVAKYATKSMSEKDRDVRYPEGCIPPFSRMSLKPGVGTGICDSVVAQLVLSRQITISDIPSHLSHGTTRRPVGRYLRNKIRERLGITKHDAVKHAYEKMDEEMQPMREAALQAPPHTRTFAFKEILVQTTEVKRQQIRFKQKIKANRKL